MRSHILGAVIIFAGLAHAQAPASAPSTAPRSDLAPTLHAVPLGLIQAACTQERTCGCGNAKGHDACVQMYVKSGLPTPTLACVAHQPCAVFCESDKAGQPGTRLHTACLTPAAQKTAQTQFTENARVAACAAFKRCGCEARPPAECAASLAVSAPKVSGAFWACAANQPCADMCAEDTHTPGGAIHTRCMLPASEALAALTAQTTQMIIQMSSKMQRQMHRTTMGIIRNMAPSNTRVDVYDGQGNYLRTE